MIQKLRLEKQSNTKNDSKIFGKDLYDIPRDPKVIQRLYFFMFIQNDSKTKVIQKLKRFKD